MTGFVYFLSDKAAAVIKIGYTSNLRQRIRAINNTWPNEVELIGSVAGTRDDEKSIHARLRDYRVKGEWYRDCPEVQALIAEQKDLSSAVERLASIEDVPLGSGETDADFAKFFAIFERLPRASAALTKAQADTDASLARLQSLAAANPDNAELQATAHRLTAKHAALREQETHFGI